MSAYSLDYVAQSINAELFHCSHPSSEQISGIGTLQDGKKGQIGFLAERQYEKFLATTSLSAVIVQEFHPNVACSQLLVDNVKPAWRKVVELFAEKPVFTGINKHAYIDQTVNLAENITVEAGVSIGADSVIENDCIIRSGVTIGRNVSIGQGCYIATGVNILDNTVIGNNAYINSGAVIGSRGFGFSFENNTWQAIAQLGRVVIGDDVEIGANTTIDRGAVNDTIIGNGVKLDNLIQVGHNVVIGDHTIIAGCCVIAGSTTIGRYCLIGGASVLAGHISICDHVQVTGHTSISKSIKKAGVYSSAFPAMPNKLWNRMVANVRRLDKKR